MKPNYHFSYKSDGAYGILPNGAEFVVDAEDADRVSEKFWNYKVSKGYIICPERQMKRLPLHRFILGITDEKIMVDHINRNKLDCRKSNLRIVTAQQNSMNCSMRPNATGFKGVSFVKSRNIYRAQIGINNRDISLGKSIDPVVCAQMYNIAARLLFGDYCGHINDVPQPSIKLIEKIELRCQPYMDEAYQATRKCGLSFCATKGR